MRNQTQRDDSLVKMKEVIGVRLPQTKEYLRLPELEEARKGPPL